MSILHCSDIVCDIAQFLCIHERAHSLGLSCVGVAQTIFTHAQTITEMRELPHRPDCMWTIVAACSLGHVACFRYLHENQEELQRRGVPVIGPRYSVISAEQVCLVIAANGHTPCLRFAIEHGYKTNTFTTATMAYFGQLECLKCACELKLPWNCLTCCYAVATNHVECLRFAHENGCPWDESVPYNAVLSGSIECLQYVLEHKCPIGMEACLKYAMENSQLDIVECLRQHGCPWGRSVLAAIQEGAIDSLRYAHEHNYPWNEEVPYTAAKFGELQCLKYAIENGCPINVRECIETATNFLHLACLQYLYATCIQQIKSSAN